MDNSKKLKEIRAKIDGIDDKILELLNKRASLVVEIGRIKIEGKRDSTRASWPDLFRPSTTEDVSISGD